MREGHRIIREVIESGIDPYSCMEPILDSIACAREWAQVKRGHDAKFGDVLARAIWFTTASGRKLAAVETEWFGSPGALMGAGADVVVCLNPAHGDKKIKKYTVAVRRDQGLTVTPTLVEIEKLEGGWGGPVHGTICGSPQDRSSVLGFEEVVKIVQATL